MTPALKKRLAEIGGRLEMAAPGNGYYCKECEVFTEGKTCILCGGQEEADPNFTDLAYLKTVVEKQGQVIAEQADALQKARWLINALGYGGVGGALPHDEIQRCEASWHEAEYQMRYGKGAKALAELKEAEEADGE